MTLLPKLADLTKLLRRPLPAPPGTPVAQLPTPAKGARPRAGAPWDAEDLSRPVTADELEQGLQQLFLMRQQIENDLADTEANRRKAIAAGDEDALRDVDDNATHALARIEIIEDRERRISQRLNAVRAIDRAHRFHGLKNELAEDAEAVLPPLREFVAAYEKYAKRRKVIGDEFPDAANILTGWFPISRDDIGRFEAAIHRMLTYFPSASAATHGVSVAVLVNDAISAGADSVIGPYSEDLEKALDETVTAIATRSMRDADGMPVKPGDEIKVPYRVARDFVRSGVAKLKEN